MNRWLQWWQTRQPRERWMLLLMFAAIAAFAYAYAMVVPAHRARTAAIADYRQAAADDAQATAALATLAGERVPQPLPAGAGWADAVADSAGAAGLAVSARGGDAANLVLEFAQADAQRLFAWLDQLRARHAVAPHALRMERRDGAVQARLEFMPPAFPTPP